MTCAHMFRTAVQRHFATIEGQRFIVFILIFIVFFNIFIYFVNLLLFVFIKYFHSFCIEKFVVSIHIAVFVCVYMYVGMFVCPRSKTRVLHHQPSALSLRCSAPSSVGPREQSERRHTPRRPQRHERDRVKRRLRTGGLAHGWMCVCVFVCLDAYLCVRVWMALTVPDESLSLCLSAGVGL